MEPGVRSSAVSCCGAVTDRSAVVSAAAVAVPAKHESASKDKTSPERARRKAMSSGYRSGVAGLEGGAPTSDRADHPVGVRAGHTAGLKAREHDATGSGIADADRRARGVG